MTGLTLKRGGLRPLAATAEITNIGQLFAALAVGWEDGSPDNRALIAGDGGQFVRVPQNRQHYPFYQRAPGDIPVESGSYLLRGFIRFDAECIFPGAFDLSGADDGAWFKASLTKRGYELASMGLVALDAGDRNLRQAAFLTPAVKDVERALAIDAAMSASKEGA